MSSKISMDNYKLSCELLGHSMDVRAVAAGRPTGETIISGSRDKSVKVWTKEEDGTYRENVTLLNHTNFISAVYYLESEGWLCTASNDATICLYKEQTIAPFHVLKGHESTVTSITKGVEAKMLVSGSWDKTARIWKVDDVNNTTVSFVILKGHEAAVWAVVTLKNGNYATGSADKSVCLWDSKGERLKVLKGHNDCVRGLIGLADSSLVSCGNDAIIRHWNEDGECLKEFCGHTNYIYTIALNNYLGDDIFITAGEDSTVRMWSVKDGILGNPLMIPAQSVWSVTCLANGDIVTGSSDGVIRVFSKDPSRLAIESVRNAYLIAVQCWIDDNQSQLGGIKKSELPGPESLNMTGKEGQTKLVRLPNGQVMCYQWENSKWNVIGDVVGASGGSQSSSGKKLFEGKEYDFVFSVDISDGVPPLNLPYNRGEDPWQSAQSFIHKNQLPQVYLEQVAEFIIKNSEIPMIAPNPVGYQDPFTGGSRYVPGSGSNNVDVSGGVDPFTGSSCYSTVPTNKVEMNNSPRHFPVEKFVSFDNCDAGKVYDKMREFNIKSGDCLLNVSDDILKIVIKLTDKDPGINTVAVEALGNLLQWPKEILFPVLDITRLAVRHEKIYVLLSSSNNFLDTILSNLEGSGANQLMTLRCLTNMMIHESGRQQIDNRLEEIIEVIKNIKAGSSNLQIAISTFFLNATILQINGIANEDKCRIITEGIIALLNWANDLEASYRSIQALGNLTCTSFGAITSAQVISTDSVMDKIREWINVPQSAGYEKLTEAASALLDKY